LADGAENRRANFQMEEALDLGKQRRDVVSSGASLMLPMSMLAEDGHDGNDNYCG